MSVYTLEYAGKQLAAILEVSEREGSVLIRRPDGKEFELHPARSGTSGLAVEPKKLGWTSDEIVESLRRVRERGPETDSD